MATDLPLGLKLRLKRREIILLVIIFLLILGIYRSSTTVDTVWRDPAVLGALGCINIYFAYRCLFQQRYIGIVASLLLALSPWYFQSFASPDKYAITLFLVTGCIWAWAAESWIVWGLLFGLTLGVHAASAILLLPFLGYTYANRETIPHGKSMIVGVVIAAIVFVGAGKLAPDLPFGYAEWTNAFQRLSFGERLTNLSNTVQPAYIIALVVYVAIVAAFAQFFRQQKKMRRYGLVALLVAVPYFVIYYFNLQPTLAASGATLTALSVLAVPALWAVDEKRQQLIFLLLWLVPSLIMLPLLGVIGPALYGFLALPLVLLACRLMDKSLDGEWLDFWWALGLPSNWYYRLGKAFVLGILVVSFFQSARA